MPIEIKHRDTGVLLCTIHGDTLRRADLYGANLYGANLRGANLRGADLRGADLRGADLRNADLDGADLCWANLSKADLDGANLYGADLYGADLSQADLDEADLSGATMCDDKLHRLLARAMRLNSGYEFFLFALQDGLPKIKAGCRWMTIPEYQAHVAKEYPDTDKARETLDILNFFEARAR